MFEQRLLRSSSAIERNESAKENMKQPHDVPSNQRDLDVQEGVEAIAGIKRGLESMKGNRGKIAEQFFEEFFSEKGVGEHESSDKPSSLITRSSFEP